jgi:hypothetical protein
MRKFSAARVAAPAAATLLLLWGFGAHLDPMFAGQETDAAADKQQREARLTVMHERAKSFEVERVISGNRQPVELHDTPVFRYSDQPRGFTDATLWCWGTPGRPAALAKLEMVVDDKGATFWQYCLASIADGPLKVDFGVRRFATDKPGIEFKPVPGAIAPQDTPAARLRQMKELFARFSATIHSKHVAAEELVKQEMRALASPIHRYGDADVDDGVIFGLTTNGTNPDLLLLVELRSVGGLPKTWHYGIVRMTDGELHVRFDDNEVWSSPYQAPKITWTSVFLPRTD